MQYRKDKCGESSVMYQLILCKKFFAIVFIYDVNNKYCKHYILERKTQSKNGTVKGKSVFNKLFSTINCKDPSMAERFTKMILKKKCSISFIC